MNVRRRMTPWRQACLLFCLAWFCTGCSKVENSNHEKRTRPLWFFFNYSIVNPTEVTNRVKIEKTKTNIYAGLTLRVLIWPRYLPLKVLDGFKDKYGATVKLETYETDHELRAKLLAGEKADLVMPAGFGLERLISEGLLEPLKPELLPNVKYIDREFRTSEFDPESRFSVPYLWSTAGIAYNFNHLNSIPHKWKDLFDPDPLHADQLVNHIALLPGPMRSYSAALINLGFSPNTRNTNEIAQAANLISGQMAKLHFRFMRAGVTAALIREDVWIALAYSSEAARAAKSNPHIHFVIPDEGSWMTIDNFAIPKGTSPRHIEMAHVFMNYLLEPTVAAHVVDHSYHASTMFAAKAFVSSDIRLGAPYNRPKQGTPQHFDPVAEIARQEAWNELTNKFSSFDKL
jgi:spermidine/putrescine transport system substrate-binding protein